MQFEQFKRIWNRGGYISFVHVCSDGHRQVYTCQWHVIRFGLNSSYVPCLGSYVRRDGCLMPPRRLTSDLVCCHLPLPSLAISRPYFFSGELDEAFDRWLWGLSDADSGSSKSAFERDKEQIKNTERESYINPRLI